jgi:hypothetical protein
VRPDSLVQPSHVALGSDATTPTHQLAAK